MTTIAYTKGTLAADSAITYDDQYKGATQKIFVSKRGGLVGVCGRMVDLASFKKWVEVDHCDPAKIPDTDGDSSAIWIKIDGTIWIVEHGKAVQIEAPFYAMGTGHSIASTAMLLGATAEQAVLSATQIDIYSRAPIQWANLKDLETPKYADNVVAFVKQ